MLLPLCLIAVGLIYTTADTTTEVPNKCTQSTSLYYGHPNNCSDYFTCVNGKPHKMTCPEGTVWSDDFVSCVTFNSYYDTCTRNNAKRECDSRRGQPLLIPHPTDCERYYNCSNTAVSGRFRYLKVYEKECPYPEVFDVKEKRCKSFKEGNCGPFSGPAKDPCDYVKNKCGSAHCVPCNLRLPSCVGKSDGRHEHPMKRWTPYFITCNTERLVSVQTCYDVDPSGVKTLFSPVRKECIAPWEDTRSDEQKQCDRQQGLPLLIPHPTECQRYYNCSNTAVPDPRSHIKQYEKECPYPDVFDVNEMRCKSFKEGNCGPTRIAPKDPCDYAKNKCGSAHCEPCSSRLPSCVGKPNGKHEHPHKPWTSYFITCDTERTIGVESCKDLEPSGLKIIFSTITKECVEISKVPRRYGGLA